MTDRSIELRRKALHMAAGLPALLLRFLTPLQAALLASGLVGLNLFLLHRLTRGSLLREDERSTRFSWGVAWYPVVILAAVLLFRTRLELAAAVWALLAFGDGMAAVYGVLLRGPALPWNRRKTWWGLAAFAFYGAVTSAFLLRWTQYAAVDVALGRGWKSEPAVGMSFLADPTLPDLLFVLLGCGVAAVAAALAESLDVGVDDNVRVGVIGGAALWAVTLVEPARAAALSPALWTGLLTGVGVNSVCAWAAHRVSAVTRSGAVSGALLGTVLYAFAGWRGYLGLVLLLVLGSGATWLGWSRKVTLRLAQASRGRRGPRHALANAGAGVTFALLAALTPHTLPFTIAMVAAFAAAAADTVSSEIGQAWGRKHLLITTLREVPAGTDGGISAIGTFSGGLAGALVAAVAAAAGLFDMRAAIAVATGAFAGGLIDSLLGATAEKRLGNEAINFTASAAGGLIAAVLGTWPG